MLGAIASRFIAVSTSVSPLTTLDVPMATLSVSALSRFSAISNDVRVRVLGSKNRLTTVRPRSAGTFLTVREPTSFIASAVSRMRTISSGESASMPSRCRPRRPACPAPVGDGCGSWPGVGAGDGVGVSSMGRLLEGHLVDAVGFLEPHVDQLAPRRRQVLAHVVGLDRQLAVAAIDHHGELDGAGPAEVDQGVQGGADGAAGEEHVVDEQDA